MRKQSGATPFPELRASWDFGLKASAAKGRRVYVWEYFRDDPRFTSFESRPAQQKLQPLFINYRRAPTLRDVKAVVSKWRPMDLKGEVRHWNDCPWIGDVCPLLSGKAVDLMGDVLRRNGVLLPFKPWQRRRYFAYVPTRVVDALDVCHSVLDDGPGAFCSVEAFSFHTDKIADLEIFRIPQAMQYTFVTGLFLDRLRALDLNIFNFSLVYPLPLGQKWHHNAIRAAFRHCKAGLPKGKKLDGERLVIQFQLGHHNKVASTAEERLFKRLTLDIAAKYYGPKSFDVPIGRVRWVNSSPGLCEIVIDGPDAEVIRITCEPLVQKLKWPHRVKFIKRRGQG